MANVALEHVSEAGARPPVRGLLARLALHRPELRAWAMYDWANSAVVLIIMTAVFPIYYGRVAGQGHGDAAANWWYPLSTSAATAIVAVFSPLLGSIADFSGTRKRCLAACIAVGAIAVAAMFLIGPGQIVLASVLFVLAAGAVSLSFVFYESLLPHIASADEIDRVSTAGYAIGYFGSGLLLIVNLLWIQKPAWFGLPAGEDLSPADATLPVRVAFLSVAVWWVLFSVPLFRRVDEPPRALEMDESTRQNPMRAALSRLAGTLRELRRYRQAKASGSRSSI